MHTNPSESFMNPFLYLCRPAQSIGLMLALPILISACASAPVPIEQMAVAEAAVLRASTASTAESAPAELQLAAAKLADARSAVKAGDSDRARRLANEATVDAEVAEIHAQATRAERAARDSQEAARALQEEINRKTPK
jgi:hypothetical protein